MNWSGKKKKMSVVLPSVFPVVYLTVFCIGFSLLTARQFTSKWPPGGHFWSAMTRTSGIIIYLLSPVTRAEEEQMYLLFLPPFALDLLILTTSGAKWNKSCIENAAGFLCDPFCILYSISFALFTSASWKTIVFYRDILMANVKWKIQRQYSGFNQHFKIAMKTFHSVSSLRKISDRYYFILLFYSRSAMVSSLSLKA